MKMISIIPHLSLFFFFCVATTTTWLDWYSGTTCLGVVAFTMQRPMLRSSSPTTKSLTQLYGESALIIQNKGGGHGEIGYQIVKNLLEKEQYRNIDSITILQDEKCKRTVEPFQSYETDLIQNQVQKQVNVIYAPIGDEIMMNQNALRTILSGQTYHYVWDNASQNDQGLGKALIDLLSNDMNYRTTLRLLCYVSSAGMYTPSSKHGRYPLIENQTPIKSSAGQNLYEQYAVSQNLPLTSFRPQYIYGPKSNKFDYM
jgi:nucleoside-diphosphate-sugar epimerase